MVVAEEGDEEVGVHEVLVVREAKEVVEETVRACEVLALVVTAENTEELLGWTSNPSTKELGLAPPAKRMMLPPAAAAK
jgi:hypothetical protein